MSDKNFDEIYNECQNLDLSDPTFDDGKFYYFINITMKILYIIRFKNKFIFNKVIFLYYFMFCKTFSETNRQVSIFYF